jgi:hypothetical protein
VHDDRTSAWSDLPIGAYRVPNTDVIVSGHQREETVVGLMVLFGPAAVHAAYSNAAAAGVSDSGQNLRIRLVDQTRSEVESLLLQGPLTSKFSLQPGAGAELDVSSAVLLTYENDTHVRAFTIVKAELKGADKRSLWETRYFASTGESRPLQGPGSWTERGVEPLRSNVVASLRQALKVMLHDVAKPYARDEQRMTVVETQFPFMRSRGQMKGYHLAEDEKYIVFAPKLPDAVVLSGVNVFDKTVTVYRPAKPEDRVYVELPEIPEFAKKGPPPASGPVVPIKRASFRVTDEFTKTGQSITVSEADIVKGSLPGSGDFELMMPPGGWIPFDAEKMGRWTQKYRVAEGNPVSQVELTGSVTAPRKKVETPTGPREVIEVTYDGWINRNVGYADTLVNHKADFKLWYSPELRLVTRFESNIRASAIYRRESRETLVLQSAE